MAAVGQICRTRDRTLNGLEPLNPGFSRRGQFWHGSKQALRIRMLRPREHLVNARFFDDDVDAVPTHCLTQGLGTISEARHIVLVATGRGKAEAVHHLVEGAVSAMWPATVLQHHPHVTVLLDDAAARRLQLVDYYRETYRSKPEWQGH